MKKALCLTVICFALLLMGCSTITDIRDYYSGDSSEDAIPVLAYATDSNTHSFSNSSIVASVKYSIQLDSSQNAAQIYFYFSYYTSNSPVTIIAKAEKRDDITYSGIIGADNKSKNANVIWAFYKPIEGPCCAELKADDFSDKTVMFTFFDYDTTTPLYNKDKQVLTCDVNFKDVKSH
jgi:hypothetical protein